MSWRELIATTVHEKQFTGICFVSDIEVGTILFAHRSSEYSNNFADMESLLYLCFFTLIVSTYAIPAESEYIPIGILINFIENFFYNNIISISRHSFRIPIL